MRFLSTIVFLFLACSWERGVHVDGTFTSELSHLIGNLTDGTKMHSALKVVKNLKIESNMVKEIMKLSPLFNQILTELGDQNGAAKIALDVIGGHVPTIKDLLHLLDGKDAWAALHNVLKNNKAFQELNALMTKPGFETSKDDVTRSIFLFTGHQFDLSSAMVPDSKTGLFQITSSAQNPYRNLVECMSFIHDNWRIAMIVLDPPNLDFSHLSQVKVMENSKYSITDSDVTKIQKMAKTVKAAQAEKSTTQDTQDYADIISTAIQVISTSLQQAMAADSSVIG